MPADSSAHPEVFEPVRLVPVHIPKPWGQEIWYTGMEARGESLVDLQGTRLPLSQYLALNPTAVCADQPVLLLKVLDPRPEDVLGDLYFEVHEEKQEVYVVSHIDPHAWPDAVGGIRLGMNQSVRQQYPNDDAFRRAYLAAVQRYEVLRRAIDAGETTADDVAERIAREAMNAFTHKRTLRVGDVVRVPTWTPHSLLHGVRVVEFQTPTYERLIISFAQQVLTQDHWDSAAAVDRMSLDAPEPDQFELLAPGVERVARFDDFNVWRIDLTQAGSLALPAHIPYAVCMNLSEDFGVGRLTLAAEEACFIPHAALPQTHLEGTGVALVAAPAL